MITRPIVLLAPDAPAPAAPSPEKPVAASVTPAPAAATPAPAPSPAVTSVPEEDVMASLDAAWSKAGASGEPLSPKKTDAPPKPQGGDGKTSAAAPAASPKPAPVVADDKRAPKELREELARSRSEIEQHKSGTAQLEQRIKEFEAKGKDTDALMARLQQRDQEYEALQGELRALKQEASPEFKKTYDEPFNRAAKYAERVLKGIPKVDGTPASFEGDFVPLYRLPYNSAYAQAREKFGEDAAPAIMEQVRELQKLDFVRQEAFEEEKKGWKERSEKEHGLRVQTQLTQTKQERDLFDKVTQDLVGSTDAYRDAVDDKELNPLRDTGRKQFEKIITAKNIPLDKKLIYGAHLKERFAAFEPNQLTIKRQSARIAELEKQVEGLKPRLPGERNARPGGVETKTEGDSVSEWSKGLKSHVEAAG